MADITKCCADSCVYETICYRKTAKANEHRQSYCDFSILYCTPDNGFEYYVKSSNT